MGVSKAIKASLMFDKKILIPFFFFCQIFILSSCANRPLVQDAAKSPSSEERAIVAVVVGDLAHDEICDFGSGKVGVAVNKYAISANDLVSDSWLEAYLEPNMWGQIKDLIRTLRRINTDDRLVDWGFPENANIISENLHAMGVAARERLLSSVRCFATFLLPAVSDDGKSALVSVYLGPSPHGAVAFYVLAKVEDRWTISTHKAFEFM